MIEASQVDTAYWASVPRPQSYADLYKNYGDPHLPSFVDRYLTVTPHHIRSGEVLIRHHVALVKPLHEVFVDLANGNVFRELITFDGCFNIRAISGSHRESLHSWGLALDFNALTNPRGVRGNMPSTVVLAFVSNGFVWGGDFQRIPDSMHFQWSVPHTI